MIKLIHLDKYFNKKSDQNIHVIQDCNLELPDKGLVSFLGPSGCGKTTLLNVIGGLDKANGSIEYDELKLSKYKMGKIDQYRVKNIGYVFQNYLLLPEETVYENIKIALNLIDIYDEAEIEKRVSYCLEVVGLQKYKKRKASQLSGGQQQRVSIARALAKNSKIIIADEPTGNLDSNNTLEVMNILKKISQTCLVLLVTHEENIANFYSDRIIRIKDGKIIDDSFNLNNSTLDYRNEKHIYLQDLEMKEEEIESGKVTKYTDHSISTSINLKIIEYKGKVYLNFENSDLVVLNDKSEIKLKNEKFKSISNTDFQKISYDTSFFSQGEKVNNFHIFFKNLKKAFHSIFQVKLRHKLMYGGFFCLGIAFAIFSSQLSKFNYFDEKQFISFDPSGYVLDTSHNYNDNGKIYEILTKNPDIEFANVSYQYIQSKPQLFLQQNNDYVSLNINLLPENRLKSNLKVLFGTMDFSGLVIDKLVAERFLQTLRYRGYHSIDQLIGLKINLNSYLKEETYIKITGIIDQEYNVGYLAENAYLNYLINKEGSSKLIVPKTKDYEIVMGKDLNENHYEVLVSSDSGIQIGEKIGLGKFEFEVVGWYSLSNNLQSDSIFLTKKAGYLASLNHNYEREISLFLTPNQKLALENQGYEIKNIYDFYRDNYIAMQNEDLLASLIILIVFSIIMIVYSYFMMRTRMLNRIYSISVYRALGAKKKEVVKQFLYEISVMTIFTNLLGFILMFLLMLYINTKMAGIMVVFLLNPLVVIGTILVMIGVNIFFGLLPIYQLIRKTPAQILAKYDI